MLPSIRKTDRNFFDQQNTDLSSVFNWDFKFQAAKLKHDRDMNVCGISVEGLMK